ADESLDHCLQSCMDTLPCRNAGGHLIRHGWDLVAHNPNQLRRDAEHFAHVPLESRLTVVGPLEHLRIHATARIDPMVLLDTTSGPIIVDHDAVIKAFSHIA